MFYYKTSFLKKAVFSEKTAKNLFVEGHDHFEGRGRLATKIIITFFVSFQVLYSFSFNNFFKKKKKNKKTIFSKVTAKNYFWGA